MALGYLQMFLRVRQHTLQKLSLGWRKKKKLSADCLQLDPLSRNIENRITIAKNTMAMNLIDVENGKVRFNISYIISLITLSSSIF